MGPALRRPSNAWSETKLSAEADGYACFCYLAIIRQLEPWLIFHIVAYLIDCGFPRDQAPTPGMPRRWPDPMALPLINAAWTHD